MALPFTDEQRSVIRERLLESARRHAIHSGPQKTSLDTLTSDAGISKSSFYKFFDSKEQLFLLVAHQWEGEILSAAMRALDSHQSDKQRAAALVFTAFECIHQMGLVRFMREDLPYLNTFVPRDAASEHIRSSAAAIFDALKRARIHFTVPDSVALSAISLIYLSLLNMNDVGEDFFPALRELVCGACDRLVC